MIDAVVEPIRAPATHDVKLYYSVVERQEVVMAADGRQVTEPVYDGPQLASGYFSCVP